jgi:hypothetical protein
MQYVYTFYVSRNRGFVELTAHTSYAHRALYRIISTPPVALEDEVDFSTLYFNCGYRGPWCDTALLLDVGELIDRINAVFSPRGETTAALSIRYLTVMGSDLSSSVIWWLLNKANPRSQSLGKDLSGWSAEQPYSYEKGEVLR